MFFYKRMVEYNIEVINRGTHRELWERYGTV